jgi:hypothetical protein
MPQSRRFTALTRVAAALAITGGLAGCGVTAVQETSLRAQYTLIGMPKAALLSCAGVPARQAAVGNEEFLTYVSRRVDAVTSGMGWYGPPWHMYGWGGGPAATQVTDCEATFTLRDGVVRRLVYGGDGANGVYSQCAAIVQNCVPPVPPLPAP